MARVRSSRRDRGATLMFFAAIVTGLLAIAGLVVDGGLLYAERRQQQNASDAAAMAGARALDQFQRGKVTSDAVWTAVREAAMRNGADEAEVTCTLVDEAGQPIPGDVRCPGSPGPDPDPSAPVSSPAVRLELATGVKAQTAATKSTNFMAVLGVSEMRAGAEATATLQAVRGMDPGTVPFMVCGSTPADLKAAMEAEHGGTFTPKPGDTLDTPLIIRSGSEWLYNGAAFYDPENGFVGSAIPVHGPQGLARCGARGSSYKGLVDKNADVTVPWVPNEQGTVAGPTRVVTAPYTTTVNGQTKTDCAAGALDDCVMVLPICSHSNGGGGAGLQMRCVTFGAFYVWQSTDNTHAAYLLPDPPVVLDGIGGGKPSPHEARFIRLYD